MVERLMIIKDGDLNEETTKGTLSQGQSFNTEEDDDSVANDSPLQGEEDSVQQGEDDSPQASTNDIHLLSPEDNKRRLLLLLNSPSMDSVNDPEGSVSDIPLIEKLKKKKRRTIDRPDISQLKKSNKKRPWYTRIDYEIFIKPLIVIGILILLYFAWVKRDVWIPRLLTSQTRLRHTIMVNEEKLNERGTTSNKDSSSNSDEDDIIDDDDKNNDQISNGDNDDDGNTPATHSKHPSQKLNIRIRRNKMSFSKDKTKKTRGSTYKLTDDGDEDDDDDDDDADVDVDEIDEVDEVDEDNEDDDDDEDNVKETDETVVKLGKAKETVIQSSKKRHHHHRTIPSREPKIKTKTKINPKAKTTLILRSRDDIVDQLNKLVKSQGKKGDLSTLLIKQTGLNKGKINRFIHGKNFSIVTLDQIISILNKFHSTLLIVSK